MILRFFFTQETDAGILSDDIQRFFRIAKAVKLIKSSSDEIEKLRDRLESYLIDISSYMRRVVSYIFFFCSYFFFMLNAQPPCREGGKVGRSLIRVLQVSVAPKGMVFSRFGHKQGQEIGYSFCNPLFNCCNPTKSKQFGTRDNQPGGGKLTRSIFTVGKNNGIRAGYLKIFQDIKYENCLVLKLNF